MILQTEANKKHQNFQHVQNTSVRTSFEDPTSLIYSYFQVMQKSHSVYVTSTHEKVLRQQHSSRHVTHSSSHHGNLMTSIHQHQAAADALFAHLQQQGHATETRDESPHPVATASVLPVVTSSASDIVTSSSADVLCNNAHAAQPCKHRAVTGAAEESNNNRNSYPELNDSSGSDSPRDTPVEPAIDLPSVNFENLLEAKETDILNDSFHSDSSHNSQSSTHHNHHHGLHHHRNAHSHLPSNRHQYSNRSLSGTCSYYGQPMPSSGSMDDILSAGQATPRIGERHAFSSGNMSDSVCSDSGSLGGDVQVTVEEADVNFSVDGDSDRTPTQEENVITKVYANTEVRLRNKKKPASTSQDSTQVISANEESTIDSQSQITSGQQQPTSKHSPEASPIWKRKSAAINGTLTEDVKRMSNISEASETEGSEGRHSRGDLGGLVPGASSSDNASVSSGSDQGQYVSVGYSRTLPPSSSTSSANSVGIGSVNHVVTTSTSALPKMTSRQHKRLYRIGLNLFNK